VNLFITWDVTPEIFEGLKTPNFYGLLFVSGLILGYFLIKKIYKQEGLSDEKMDKLVIYIVLATIIGARLGHVLFYGPYLDGIDDTGFFERGYFSHPLDILKVWEGGLASHGATIALFISLYIYSKKILKKPLFWILDRIVISVAFAACFIRLGNLMNSEIVGIPSDLPWAFSFPNFYNAETGNYDATPRHPAQLYEAISYLVIGFTLVWLYFKKNVIKRPAHMFAWFMILLWTARFFVEFIKIGQTSRDFSWALKTGQLLSIPMVLFGVYLLVFYKPKVIKEE
jgi:phosphatidylglycerol:prolipoprotein diacylglycerol transferase